MDLKLLFPAIAANPETLLLGTALHYAIAGKIETKHLDISATAIALFALATQLEEESPGTAEKYGWAKIADLQGFARSLQNASEATPPAGLK